MKKRMNSVFFAMLGLFAFQGNASAMPEIANYHQTSVKTVSNDQSAKTQKELFSKSGSELIGITGNGFTVEGYQGAGKWNALWDFYDYSGNTGAKPENIVDGDTDIESYLVSSVIRLHEENIIEIGHVVRGYAEGEAAKHLSLCIRESGTDIWETVNGLEFFAEDIEDYTQMSIDSKYNNKDVQFGFRYTAENKETAGSWILKSITVYGLAPDPVEADYRFEVTETEYQLGSRLPFSAPVLNNPNNIKVDYSTDNYDIASVDNQTGAVTIYGEEGVVTITAKSKESVEYLAGEASYTIKVYDPLLVYKAVFSQDACDFVEDGTNVWKNNWGTLEACNPVDAPTVSYLVSPEIELGEDGYVVSYLHNVQGIEDIQNHVGICVRTVGGEWQELTINNWPVVDEWQDTETGDILIPAEYNGKTVQFAIRFTLDETTFAENVGTDWPNVKYTFRDFKVCKYIERGDADLSFNREEYTYYMGEIPFESPVANNPNEVQIKYSVNSEGSSVISIDEKTGEVKILDEGKAVVYVNSDKNNEYLAGEASYNLNVVDLSLVFRHKFGKDGFGDFIQEGGEGMWKDDGWGNTSAENNPELEEGTKSYLVSPVITLDANGNKAYWLENGYECNFATQSLFAVREVGGEWTEITDIDRSVETESGKTEAFCEIPVQFNGKEVQVAFVFIQGDPNSWHSWNINDLRIKKNFTKIDPALTFDMVEAKYVKGEEFRAPVLNNPENVDVVYTSDNILVATVNVLTGELEFIGEGVTVITASNKENNKYLASDASYSLTVSFVPTDIKGVSIDMNDAKIYNLQGNRVQNVVKGNIYIINGKKILVK